MNLCRHWRKKIDGMWIAGCQSVRMACNAARDPANLVVGDSSFPPPPPPPRHGFSHGVSLSHWLWRILE